MAVDDFYLSDDSDGEYEEERKKKIAYDELVILEIEKKQELTQERIQRCQQQSALKNASPSIPLSRRHHHPDFGSFKTACHFIKSMIGNAAYFIIHWIHGFLVFVRQIRFEAIAACFILYCTLLLMMEVSSSFIAEELVTIAEHAKEEKNPLTTHYQHVRDLYATTKETDTPFYWKIPFSSRPIEDVLRTCVQVETLFNPDLFQDVNTTDFAVFSTANIAANPTESMIMSTDIYEASKAFTPSNLGKVFTVMKNPVYAVVDRYQHMISTIAPQAMNVSFLEYIESPYVEDNMMTRALTGKLTPFGGEAKDIRQKDLDNAIEILRQKCLVGLYHKINDFFVRLDNYLQWELRNRDMAQCRESVLLTFNNENSNVLYPPEGSSLWRIIAKKNRFDMQLFRVAEVLFEEQGLLSFI